MLATIDQTYKVKLVNPDTNTFLQFTFYTEKEYQEWEPFLTFLVEKIKEYKLL